MERKERSGGGKRNKKRQKKKLPNATLLGVFFSLKLSESIVFVSLMTNSLERIAAAAVAATADSELYCFQFGSDFEIK